MNCPHTEKPCVNRYLCEMCRVPNAFGYFMTLDKRGLMKWEQRFITEADRRALVAGYDQQIGELEKLKAEVATMKSKQEYEGGLK